jgi:hypothetical protein
VAEDRSYIEANTLQRERMRALVEGLDDEALEAPVNEYWTVAGVLGHIAYWDIRVLVLAEKIDRGEPWAPGDAEPDGDWLNDSTRPLIHAIRPRDAAEFALRIAADGRARGRAAPRQALAARPRQPDLPSPSRASRRTPRRDRSGAPGRRLTPAHSLKPVWRREWVLTPDGRA